VYYRVAGKAGPGQDDRALGPVIALEHRLGQDVGAPVRFKLALLLDQEIPGTREVVSDHGVRSGKGLHIAEI
jgi:hypothetical protein